MNAGRSVVAVLLFVSVLAQSAERAWHFPTDILPRFTQAGCNAGKCHGAATGQGGFKLSLLGDDPAADDHHPGRHLPKLKRLSTRDHHAPVHRKAGKLPVPGAGGDDDVVSGKRLAAVLQAQGVPVCQRAGALDELDLVLSDQHLDATGQTPDHLPAPVYRLSEVHTQVVEAYSELIGQDAASEKQAGDIDLLAIKKARDESPVIDLFGSGLGVAGRLRVGHFLPSINVLPEEYTGVRKDLGDTEGAVELLSEADATAYYGREASNNRRSQAEANVTSLRRQIRTTERKGDNADELKVQLEEAEKVADKYKKDMGDMQVSSRTIVSHHALPAGIDLQGRIVIVNAKDRDLDLIEFGLGCLSQSPVLGAQSARGCGEITGSFDVSIGGYAPAKTDVF